MSFDKQPRHHPTTSPSFFWFLLLDSATNLPYKGTSATKVTLSPSADLDDFREAVQQKYDKRNYLKDVPSSALIVYKDKLAYDDESVNPLKSSHALQGLGKSEEEALIVVVSSSRNSRRSVSAPVSPVPEPNSKRKRRWIELNEILGAIAQKSKTNDSTAYSYVTWNQVKSLFNPTNYVQPRREIDEAQLGLLAQYLSITTRCFGDISTGREAKRLHFIAPVLICVCSLFDGDVDIVVEEELVGNFVKAHGHFEFMIKRGRRAVCIVEAKKDDVEQGMAQDLVGCEVAAELGGLDIVYGIVTNYIQWNFLRSLNDKVEREECSLRLTPHGPERESLKEIAEKIYAMLSN